MLKHTPGPWVISNDGKPLFGNFSIRQNPDDWDGMGYQSICTLPSSTKGSRSGDMFLANATLIAAAPDLLAACQEFCRKVDNGEARSTRSYAQMAAAIEKATTS